MNVGDWITKRNILSPNKIAIIFENQKIVYQEVHDQINRLANALLEVCIRKGDRAGA